MKTMSIDYIRELIENTLAEEHEKNPNFFGGKNQVNLFSFYEQLQEDYEVDRFTEIYRDLVDQQNRTGLIMNGTIVAPENPQMLNTHNHTIIPLTYNVSFRVALKDRDDTLATLDNLFKVLKGRKQDIAELDTGVLFEVGTMANDVNGVPSIKSGDYIGDLGIDNPTTQQLNTFISNLESKGLTNEIGDNGYIYFKGTKQLRVAKKVFREIEIEDLVVSEVSYSQDGDNTDIDIQFSFSSVNSNYTAVPQWLGFATGKVDVFLDDRVRDETAEATFYINYGSCSVVDGIVVGTAYLTITRPNDAYDYANLTAEITELTEQPNCVVLEQIFREDNYSDVIFPPQHTSFSKYKVSISFDSIRIDEPKTLNAKEYITIMFGGSATIADGNVVFGNQLTKVGIKRYKIKAQTDISITDDYHWLEPLEMPSGLGISGEISQLASHNFLQNTHNDGIKASINYSFVLDFSEELIKQWFRYARYGITGSAQDSFLNGSSPNMLYKIKEIWSSWGEVEVYEITAKLVDNVDIENTESDSLSIKTTFDIQKE